jgi:hypothetical protein
MLDLLQEEHHFGCCCCMHNLLLPHTHLLLRHFWLSSSYVAFTSREKEPFGLEGETELSSKICWLKDVGSCVPTLIPSTVFPHRCSKENVLPTETDCELNRCEKAKGKMMMKLSQKGTKRLLTNMS